MQNFHEIRTNNSTHFFKYSEHDNSFNNRIPQLLNIEKISTSASNQVLL